MIQFCKPYSYNRVFDEHSLTVEGLFGHVQGSNFTVAGELLTLRDEFIALSGQVSGARVADAVTTGRHLGLRMWTGWKCQWAVSRIAGRLLAIQGHQLNGLAFKQQLVV